MNDIDRKSFGSYFGGCFTKPGRTFASLLADGRRVRMAALAVLVPAAGYTLMYLLAWIAGGAPSTFKPWLAIPIQDYFKWDIFIVAPSMFGCWVLASGSTQLVARALGGRGSFEDSATVIGFGIGVASCASLVHDLTDAALGAAGIIDMKVYEEALNSPTFWRALLWTLWAMYFIAFLVIYTKGFRAAHGLPRGKAIFLAVLGLVVYQGFFLVFNR